MLEARAGRHGGAPDAAGADRPHVPMCIARDAVASTGDAGAAAATKNRLRPQAAPLKDMCPKRRARVRELPLALTRRAPWLQAAGRRSRRPGPVVDAVPPCP